MNRHYQKHHYKEYKIMKKLLKSALLMLTLILTHSLTFAAAKTSEIYVSEAPVSDLSWSQLLNTSWFWILIAVCIVAFVVALIATKDEEEQTHFPEHSV